MASEKPTSLTLLERVRGRDQEAWQRLLHLYAPLVAYWCKHWGVRGPDAEDVIQEVFQAVAAGLEGFRREHAGDTFRGWLRGITRHKVLDHLRRQQRQPVAQGGTDAQRHFQQLSEPPTPAPDDSDDPEEELTRLYHRALELVRAEPARGVRDHEQTSFWAVVPSGMARTMSDRSGTSPRSYGSLVLRSPFGAKPSPPVSAE